MLDLKNLEWLKADAVRAKQLGFQGKLCIHPNQIETCHDVFSPTDEEIQYARRVIQAFEEAEAKGVAAIQLEGKFIDYPVVERSRRILRLAAAVASN
jgi:citrate lyase subunit beta/citryl-CoA lyase